MKKALIALFALSLTACLPHRNVKPLKNEIVRLSIKLAEGRAACSGTVISDQYVITAAHCTQAPPNPFAQLLGVAMPEAAPQITVVSDDGEVSVPVIRIFTGNSDQSILQGDFTKFRHRPIMTDMLSVLRAYQRENSDLRICGFPYAGRLTCLPFKYHGPRIFDMGGEGPVYPGMSGGPVIDMNTGAIVGTVTAMSGDEAIVTPSVETFRQMGIDN